MKLTDLQMNKLIVIERLSQVIKDLSKTTFEVDGNEIIGVDINYSHQLNTSNNKKCSTNIILNIQFEEDLKIK